MTVAECEQKCDGLVGCTAIVTEPVTSGLFTCFRKADVDLSHCDAKTSFDTYLKPALNTTLGF